MIDYAQMDKFPLGSKVLVHNQVEAIVSVEAYYYVISEYLMGLEVGMKSYVPVRIIGNSWSGDKFNGYTPGALTPIEE